MTKDAHDLLTVQEFAEVSRRSPGTIYKWIAKGLIVPVRLPSGGLLLAADELARVQRTPTTADHGRHRSDRRAVA